MRLISRSAPSRVPLLAAAGAVLALAAALLLVAPPDSHAALQKMAGYSKAGGTTSFGSISSYLNNLRDGLLPLSIPVGSLGLVAGGVLHVVGHQNASKILFGVLLGMGLVFGSPSIIA